MSFLFDLLVALLTAYISFTNSLATGLINFFNPPLPDPVELATNADDSFLNTLPGRLSTVPDILLRSSEYQQAAVGDAVGLTEPTTTDPLDALVNIFCTFRSETQIKTTTGTGFFIDADGVIMTNAHVAQFILLATTDDYGVPECRVRSGNPASAMYTADLLYIPPAWVQDNAAVLNDAVPMGTGERDYALLYVTGTITGEPMPAAFPALPYSSELLSTGDRGTTVTPAGYPAGALQQNGASTNLVPVKANTTISELYTFGSNRADVFSIGGTIVGDEGASGGPVVDETGTVIGMIVTRGDDVTDGPGSLRAITLSHVESTMLEETGFTLQEHLGGNLALRAEVFEETLSPFLLSILQNAE